MSDNILQLAGILPPDPQGRKPEEVISEIRGSHSDFQTDPVAEFVAELIDYSGYWQNLSSEEKEEAIYDARQDASAIRDNLPRLLQALGAQQVTIPNRFVLPVGEKEARKFKPGETIWVLPES